eukprot:TRINITY_DN7577_c0_g1_i1.p1 TRINITY_DN7577_c0_g1~~TRINITY_DN7577_c0_g1_i1.p1  ORF type:complete len:798 (-),score=158.58 TRINITY_DN7577_c0_g1_i1:96-2489(-)
MAEAHSIAALASDLKPQNKSVQLVKDDEGFHFTLSVTIPPWDIAIRSAFRIFYRQRNRLVNVMYPVGIASYIAILSILVFVVLTAEPDSWWRSGYIPTLIWNLMLYIPFFEYLPRNIQIAWAALAGGPPIFILFVLLQRYLLRGLLHYHGWLHLEPGQKVPLKIKLWAFTVRALQGSKPLLYSYGGSLPRLPVPSLKATTDGYLNAMEPLQTPEEFEETKILAKQFLENEGPRLQWYLKLKAWISDNYISDWWETYIYLHGRSSLLINSNYYGLDQAYFLSTSNQIAKAANMIHEAVKFSVLIERETLPPFLMNETVPICMHQVSKLFSTTRVPRKDCDVIRHWDAVDSRHIVVVVNNVFYKLNVFHNTFPHGPLQAWEIEDELYRIAADSVRATLVTPAEGGLAALTTMNRTRWAEVHEEYFGEGVNFQSLSQIESAMFFVHLSDSSPKSIAEQGRLLLCDDSHIWCDKSINMVVFKNGRAGINCEHTWGDAVVTAHMLEYVLTGDCPHGAGYDAEGRNNRPPNSKEHAFAKGREPRRLTWEIPPQMEAVIELAVKGREAMRADLALEVVCQEAYGKGYMKKVRMSPDAYIQLAMQLAFFRDQGRFQNTYEATTTRLFKNGRTETVRPVTKESCAFVRAFEDPAVSACEKAKLMRQASETHSRNAKNSMTGKGIDRHLFGLYIVSVGRSIESPFLKQALSCKWVLSTSQQPQVQTKRWDPFKNPEDNKLIGAGGGFGPVADDGYGVSYMLADDNRIFFHVSSKRSSPLTDSTRFGENIMRAFRDLKVMFDEASKEK